MEASGNAAVAVLHTGREMIDEVVGTGTDLVTKATDAGSALAEKAVDTANSVSSKLVSLGFNVVALTGLAYVAHWLIVRF